MSDNKPEVQFARWFKRQYGRSASSNACALRHRVEQLELKLFDLRRELANEEWAETARDAALKGWVAGQAAAAYQADKQRRR